MIGIKDKIKLIGKVILMLVITLPIFSNTIKVDEVTNVYVKKAPNGVKVVNISTPSEKGISDISNGTFRGVKYLSSNLKVEDLEREKIRDRIYQKTIIGDENRLTGEYYE